MSTPAAELPPHVWREGADAGSSAAPPLLLLHGTGGDEHDLLPLAGALSPGSAVLSVRGRVLEGALPRHFARLAEGVFDEDDLRARTDDLADDLVTAEGRYGVAPGTWVAVGFSNGANIAASLLVRRPEALAGAVLLAAMVPYREAPAVSERSTGAAPGRWAVVANGRRDPMATPAQTAALVAQLRRAGVAVGELPHDGGHTVDGRQLPALAAIITAGGPAH